MECAYRAGQGVQRSLELSLSAAWIPICTGYSGDTLNAMFQFMPNDLFLSQDPIRVTVLHSVIRYP